MLVPPHAIAGGYLIRTPRGPLPITLKKLRTFFGQGPESLEPAIRSLNQAIDMLDLFPGKLVAGHSRATRANYGVLRAYCAGRYLCCRSDQRTGLGAGAPYRRRGSSRQSGDTRPRLFLTLVNTRNLLCWSLYPYAKGRDPVGPRPGRPGRSPTYLALSSAQRRQRTTFRRSTSSPTASSKAV